MSLLRVLAISAALPFAAGVAHAQVISLITTPAGTFSNSAASAMAKVVTEKAKIRMTVQAQASSGYEELEAGSAELTVSNSFDSTFFATGTGDYAGRGPSKTLRHVAAIAIGEAGRASIDGRYFEARHLDIVAAGLTALAAARTPSAHMAA